jgi:hypothetical protein
VRERESLNGSRDDEVVGDEVVFEVVFAVVIEVAVVVEVVLVGRERE